ncbi:MAG: hypothetical protein RIB43_06415 [Rhodospirillaceae bacterium]
MIDKAVTSDTLYHFYDLDHAPTTFNALMQFVSAEIARVETTDFDNTSTIFVPGLSDGFNPTNGYDAAIKRWRFWSIVIPSLRLFQSNRSHFVLSTREEASEFLDKASGNVFPFGYELKKSSDCPQINTPTLNAYLGFKSPSIRPPERATQLVKQLVDRVCQNQRFVTITARGSLHLPQRNTSLGTLNKIARYMQQSGYFVFFLPDYEIAMEMQNNTIPGVYLCREAALDLTFRAALYELASLNIGDGGPMTLCCFNSRCNYIINNLRWPHGARDIEKVMRHQGFAVDKGINYHNRFARWLWSFDEPDETIDACADFIKYSQGENIDVNKSTASRDEVFHSLSDLLGPSIMERIKTDYLNRAGGPLFINREFERGDTRTTKHIVRNADVVLS